MIAEMIQEIKVRQEGMKAAQENMKGDMKAARSNETSPRRNGNKWKKGTVKVDVMTRQCYLKTAEEEVGTEKKTPQVETSAAQ